MKRLLLATTSAAVLIGMSGAASAQSVLERVLSQTQSLNDVTGIFANTADNIGTTSEVLSQARFLEAGDTVQIGVDDDGIPVFATVNAEGEIVIPAASATFIPLDGLPADTTLDATGLQAATLGGALVPGIADGSDIITTQTLETAGSIDGSIDIVARRIQAATASVEGEITAIEGVTTNFGNMATTVLGAVNTGEIGLGTNQLVEEAIAGSSQAIRSTVEQVGTLADRTQIAVNSALNTMDINGSINIELDGVNASVATITPDQLDIVSGILRDEDGGILGSTGVITLSGLDQLLGSMETTVLGAVNTGTIVSGVDNQVSGAVAGIIGNSATNMFGN